MGSHAFTSAASLLLVFALGTPGTSAAAPDPSTSPALLDLSGAVRFALEHSPALDSGRKARDLRELEHRNARARLLPSLDLRAIHGLQDRLATGAVTAPLTPGPTAPWTSSLSLGLTETLYDNGISLTRLQVADLNREVADLEFLKARDSLTLEVVTEFHRFSLASALLEVRKQQQSLLDKQLGRLTEQYQQGLKTKNDLLRLKADAQRAQIERINAENQIGASVVTLRKLLGTPLETPAPPNFEPEPVRRERNAEALLPEAPPAFRNFYDFRLTRLQEEINEADVTLARRNHWPRLSLTSELAYSNAGYVNSGAAFSATGQVTWNALLTVEYNLWDWGTRRRDVALAETNRDIRGNTLKQSLQELQARVDTLMIELSRLRHGYRLSQELLTLEETSSRELQAQYREGKVSYLDLVTALDNLLNAKVRFYTAYFEVLQGVARHRYFERKLYEATSQE